MSKFDAMMENVANARTAEQSHEFTIRAKSDPNYCGIGAGGVQFANGQAVTKSRRMADWFREHSGYEVTQID